MSLAEDISPHLPYLRRFSRALNGSQDVGDAFVVSTLQALVADPSILVPDLPPRNSLYKAFLKLWNESESSIGTSDKNESHSAAERNLKSLTPLTRQAFLLRTVEGFGIEDVASILGVSPIAGSRLLDTAGREIAEQVNTTILIIEDEPIIALDIEATVEELGHTVNGIARTRKEALELFNNRRPGLVLADVKLADGSSGLDAVNDILEQMDVPVIFITAYPERLLTGSKPEPTFLITKPFQPSKVKAAISQALFFDRRATKKALKA